MIVGLIPEGYTLHEDLEHVGLFTKVATEPWLVWLSGLSVGLRTKGSLVQFPAGAHA